MEFPYLYRATRKEEKKQISVRYSEAEPIEFALAQKGFLDWVWIDTNTVLPISQENKDLLSQNFKTCLVSPDRWGRPEDIEKYKKQITDLNFKLDAVMVGAEYVDNWQ